MKFLFFPFLFLSCFFILPLRAFPAQIFIIRHAEKLNKDNELSLKGKERAAALTPYFMETEALLANGTVAAIYAIAAPTEDSSQHSIQTVTPLANELQLTIKSNFGKEEYKKMVNEIKSDPALDGKVVLICWDHTFIPEISRAFGALQTPNRWPGEIFDRIWIISLAQNGRTSFQNLPQRLMYGDSYN